MLREYLPHKHYVSVCYSKMKKKITLCYWVAERLEIMHVNCLGNRT